MPSKEQIEFEQKLEEVHKNFKNLRRRAFLIWVGYMAVTVPLILLLLMKFYPSVGLVVLIMNLLCSIVLMFNCLKRWNELEAEQRRLLMEKAPVERMRF